MPQRTQNIITIGTVHQMEPTFPSSSGSLSRELVICQCPNIEPQQGAGTCPKRKSIVSLRLIVVSIMTDDGYSPAR